MNVMSIMKIRLVFGALLVAVLSACSTTRQSAPVVDRSPVVKAEAAKPKPVEGRGYYTVKKGDTLYRIALEFGQNYRDIVAWNNLASPNDIRVDQVLRVLPPETGTGPGGAQTGTVATTSGVEVRPLNAATATTAAASSINKTGPLGAKRPYSDTALAELQKPEVPDGRAEPSKNGENTEEAGIAWMWPADGKIIGNFDGGKKGIDIAGKSGQAIVAAGSGTVLYASSVRGYGNLVIVKHTNNLLSAYAHNKTILVKEGQNVSMGQKIAEMGSSDTDAVKLHFEIRQLGKPVDPSKFLPNR
jgi:lipoprotein NlpD